MENQNSTSGNTSSENPGSIDSQNNFAVARAEINRALAALTTELALLRNNNVPDDAPQIARYEGMIEKLKEALAE